MRYIIIISLGLIALASCKTSKKMQKNLPVITKDTSTHFVVVDEDVKKMDSFLIVKNILDTFKHKQIDFETFKARIKFEYQENDNSQQATANVNIRKDSAIWINITGPLGVQVARLLITQDSVKLLDMLKKTIEIRSIDHLETLTQIPFDFKTIQDMIVGNAVFIDDSIVSYKNTDNELEVLLEGDAVNNLLRLGKPDYKMIQCDLNDNENEERNCNLQYFNYTNNGNMQFPTGRKISVKEKSTISIFLDFKQYSFNEAVSFSFNIPKNYKSK